MASPVTSRRARRRPACTYPFTGIMGGTFNKQVTGSKTFDFNTNGGAHYGLMADFFADLKRQGMTDAELDPLLNSAETYIRLWEKVNDSDLTPPPTITAVVNGLEGHNGWSRWRRHGRMGGRSARHRRHGGADRLCSHDDLRRHRRHGHHVQGRQPHGRVAQSSVIIRRDATPPTFTATRLSATPASGWTNQDVHGSLRRDRRAVRPWQRPFDHRDDDAGRRRPDSAPDLRRPGGQLCHRLAGRRSTSTRRGRASASASRTCRRSRRPRRRNSRRSRTSGITTRSR